MDFLALGITRQSVVTLVGSWALVVNAAASRVIVGEKLIFLDVAAIACIIGGIVCTVAGSDRTEDEWTLEEMMGQYRKTE